MTFFEHLPYSSHEMVEIFHGCDVVVIGFKFHIRVDFSVRKCKND